jgi:RHS repeat-associated protein
MSSSIGKKNIAHKGSGHGAAAPPAMSLLSPPVPPAPAPFPYVCRAATASNTLAKYRINGSDVLLVESTMDIDPPANQPSQGTAGDILTHAVTKIGVMTTGSIIMTVDNRGICGTGDIVAMNVLSAKMKFAQMQAPLLEGADLDIASKSSAAAAEMNEKYLRAFPPPGAKQTTAGDPVDLGTGFVVDDAVDLALRGSIPLIWRRTYSSALHAGASALGKGGWVHSFEQRMEVIEPGVRFHDEEGLPIDFLQPPPGGASFHRGRRLELRKAGAGYELRSLEDRLVRHFTPSPSGRFPLRSIEDAYHHQIQLDYDGERLVRIRDCVGREIRIVNDGKGRVGRVEVWAAEPGSEKASSLQTWFDYSYHPEGELASHFNALGHAKRWEYDGLHRLVKTTARNGISFYYQYDETLGRCERTWGDGGLHEVRLIIDPARGETRTHGTGRARRYLWKNGIVRREETFDGAWASEREYDDDEFLIARSNAAGETTTYERDARGNLVKETDPAGNVTTWEYKDDLPARRVDPTGLETRYEHDHRGALVFVAWPTGVVHQLERDREGRLLAIRGLKGTVASLTYDDRGEIASVTSGRGGTTSYRHDALGRAVEQIDPLGRATRAQYDAIGQLTEVQRPDGTSLTASYDSVGNLATSTDALGRITRLEYSGTGHLARITQPDGQVYSLRHDADERLVEILNPRLESYRFDYDRADRVVAERTFDERLLEYRYNLAGRITRIDYSGDEWRELSHDKLGNILEDRGSDVQIRFTRDVFGRIEEAECEDMMGKVVTRFERDSFGRVTAEVQNDRAVRHEYDAEGRRAARITSDSARTEYRYDEDDMFTGVTHGGYVLSIRRDIAGRERVREGKGWRLETEYDYRDRVLSQMVQARTPSNIVVQRLYGYDSRGRVTSIDSPHAGRTNYLYDDGDQLVESTCGRLREVFEYDPAGSLINALRGLEGQACGPTWSLASGNRLRATGHARYVNDARGRRIKRIERAGGKALRQSTVDDDELITIYGWDSKDRLREVILPDEARIRFQYDAFGRRVRKDVLPKSESLALLLTGTRAPAEIRSASLGSSTEFLWDGNVLCEEHQILKSGGSRHRIHVHEPDNFRPLLQVEGARIFAVIVDPHGVPKELVDELGRVAFRGTHGAWGDVVGVERDKGAAAVESPFRLLGQYADEETGLCYTRFRYFEPERGRWLSPDPLEILGGLNLAGFNGAPTLMVDPLGLADPWAPHNPGQNDIIGKGIHFNTDVPGLELSVRSDDGETIRFQRWPKPDSPMTGDAAEQRDAAKERLGNNAKWRAKLLQFAEEGIKQLRENHKMEELAKAMERVRDALKTLGANKSGQA